MNPTPKIAYILKMYPRFSETFILNELLELERQGLNLRVFSLKKPDDGRFHADVAKVRAPVSYLPESPLLAAGAFLAAHREVFGWDRLRYLRVLAWTLGRAAARRRWGGVKRFLQAGYLAPRLREAGIEHVHAHFASSATTVAFYLNRLAGVSYSFTAHAKDIYSDGVDPADLARKLREASHVVTVSDYNQTYLTDLEPAARVARIYNGLDLEQFAAAERVTEGTEPPLILAVGRLVEKKGFDDLIRACALLRDQGCRFRCRIVGKGPQEGRLRALIAEMDLADRVELVGPLPREALLELYPRATAVVAPCVIGADGNRDGLPTVLIEAMALGVPVVSTDVTGIPELVEDGRTGLIVPQHDAAALARAIRFLADNPVRADALARAGRQQVEEKFDLKANIAHHRALLEGSLGANTEATPRMQVRLAGQAGGAR